MLVTQHPEQVLLFLLAFIVPFYLEKAIVDRPETVSYTAGISINLSDILTLTLFFILLTRLALKQVKFTFFNLVTVAAFTWLFASLFSLPAAEDGELALFQFINMGKLLLFCLVIASSVRSDLDLTLVTTGLLLSMAFQSLVGIYQGLTGHPLGLSFLAEATEISKQQLSVGLVNRVQGTLGSPNTLAMYLCIGVPFALALLFSKTKPYVKVLAAIALCLTSWALIFSLSRAAWVNFLLITCFVLVLAARRKQISSKAAILIASATALVLLGISLFGTNLILSRLTSNDQSSITDRISLAEGALAIIRDNPVVGVGLNNYPLVSPRYGPADAAAWNSYAPIVHNAFLLIAAETGILGLGAFLVFIITLLIQTWWVVDHTSSSMVWIAGVGVLGGLVALMVHNMVDYELLGSSRVFTLFWLLTGLSTALMHRVVLETQDSGSNQVTSNATKGSLRSYERARQDG